MALNANALCTLADLKAQLGITGSTEDARLEMYINAASQFVERFTGRKLAAQDLTEYHSGRDSNYLIPKEYPIRSITEIRTSQDRDWLLASSLRDPSSYRIADDGYAIQLDLNLPTGHVNTRLTYNAGYSPLPSDLVLAGIWISEWYYKMRSRGDMGRTSVSKGDESVGILQQLPPMIQEILQAYKRVEVPNLNLPARNL